jgi:hypothetical protein
VDVSWAKARTVVTNGADNKTATFFMRTPPGTNVHVPLYEGRSKPVIRYSE